MGVTATVAICTYNRARLLERGLEALTRLRVPAGVTWELIVVDNNCTDDTQAVCAKYVGRLPITVVPESARGLSNARNRAMRTAHGRYLVFTDDDVRIDAGWLEAFLEATTRYPEAVAFGGPIEPDFPHAPDPDLVAAFPALAKGFCGLDHERPEGVLPDDLAIWGANMAYRFDAVSSFSFDPNLGVSPTRARGGEEEAFLDLVRANGGAVVWVPTMRVKHYVDPSRMTLEYLVAFQIGKGEQHVYRDRPTLSGRSAWGAPIWLIRRMVSAYGRYLVSRVTSTRARALEDLKAYCHYRGMVRACREFAAAGQPYNRPRVAQ